MENQKAHSEAQAIVQKMTIEDKAAFLTGHRMWRTHSLDHLGVRALVMTDGTHGVRYSIPQIDEDQPAGQDFEAFLSMVNRKANEVEVAWGTMKPATCFPNGSSVACSWDVDLACQMGAALGLECRAFGIDLLLGPGVNIRRTPLGGRVYEYLSEDPILTGDLAASLIKGVQSRGVGTSIKHFACNNNEVERTTMNNIVDSRALREIYLLGYQRAIKKSDPWTVMSSYNRLNGVQVAENPWLLNTVLRDEWGYKGLVMSDWHGIKDRPASVAAGNDLDMPESKSRHEDLLAAMKSGNLSMEAADLSCQRLIELVRRCEQGSKIAVPALDADAHHQLARKIAGSSNVLLKNHGGILPLRPEHVKSIAVIGEGAVEAVIQGSGCATTAPTQVDVPLDEIRALAGQAQISHYRGTGSRDASNEAVAGARAAEVAIVFVNTEVGWDGEGSDRQTLALGVGQDELVKAVAAANRNTVVVMSSPDAVAMPWIDNVAAVLATFFSGQAMGGAVADILFGVVNPSGKLTTSFPRALEDIPGYLNYPGENGEHIYSEGLFVGYRTYNTCNTDLLFPFGYGLSYSTFEYSDMAVSQSTILDGDTLKVSFNITNTSSVTGSEVTQVYARYGKPRVRRPRHELKGFTKTVVPAGETVKAEISIDADDLRYYDTLRKMWILDNDDIVIEVGASSRDIKLHSQVSTRSPIARYREILWDTQPQIILETPVAREKFRTYLSGRLSITDDEAEKMLIHCGSSFFGLVTTLDRRLRQRFPATEIQALLDDINLEIKANEVAGIIDAQ
ncbi:unnamed protein product [Clonostachys chloroleuca]|uniref:beta-glucosidase n=1 Tax=Clonostachys chloroleuca TaxID=1926264 RepID=A0AA35MF77_9HYPO|nr:unnamed protein product [Clonostachys chloroleuca]